MTWALRIAPCDGPRLVRRLAALRLSAGVEACQDGAGATWLRGEQADGPLELRLRAAGGARFTVSPDGELTPLGSRLPAGRLPQGPWRPLRALLVAELPGSIGAAGPAPARVALTLVRATTPADAATLDEPGLLLTAREAFGAWALGAPEVRLAGLEVAARADRPRVLLRGRPLPPLPGARFVVAGQVATPAGVALWPALDEETLAALLGLKPRDLALVRPAAPEGGDAAPGPATVERVEARRWQPASRALARGLA